MKKLTLLSALIVLLFSACEKDDGVDNATLTLNLSGLEDLGSDYQYEGWLIVNGSPVTTGVFTVDASGEMSKTGFSINKTDLEAASTFVLTIEPSPDNDPAPAATHILAGDFDGSSAALTVGHGAALGSNFTSATGEFILATPTNGADTDENSGIWWLDPGAGPGAGLSLPTLPGGWKYEGWTVIDGVPVTTGRFSAVNVADDAAPFSGTMDGPPFPGEDFLTNAPSGLTFPTDLSGGTAVISIEPEPDNSELPFLLKPLVGAIPAAATHGTLYTMNNNASGSNPTGSATR